MSQSVSQSVYVCARVRACVCVCRYGLMGTGDWGVPRGFSPPRLTRPIPRGPLRIKLREPGEGCRSFLTFLTYRCSLR